MGYSRPINPVFERLPLFGAVEGQQELKYFHHLRKLIQNEPKKLKQLDVHYENAEGRSALNVVFRAKKQRAIVPNNTIIGAVYDHDMKHDEFTQALELCRTNKISPYYSNICFDLWLILHKTDYNCGGCRTDTYVTSIKRLYGLNPADDIKSDATIQKMLEQISLDDVYSAVARAETIRGTCKTTDRRIIATMWHKRCEIVCYDNPDLTIHHLVKYILQECLGCRA